MTEEEMSELYDRLLDGIEKEHGKNMAILIRGLSSVVSAVAETTTTVSIDKGMKPESKYSILGVIEHLSRDLIGQLQHVLELSDQQVSDAMTLNAAVMRQIGVIDIPSDREYTH